MIESRSYRAEPSMDENGNTDGPCPDGPDPIADLFRTVYPGLRRYAAVVATPTDDPDDLVQEALSRMLTNATWPDIGDPAAYLRRSIANLVIDRSRRKATRMGRRHLVAVDGDRSDVYPSDLAVLDHLDPIDRSILYLVDVEGRPFAEVADTVGCTNAAARLRASRARRRLRTLIEEQS